MMFQLRSWRKRHDGHIASEGIIKATFGQEEGESKIYSPAQFVEKEAWWTYSRLLKLRKRSNELLSKANQDLKAFWKARAA